MRAMSAAQARPFTQGRFRDLPELPRRPHPFAAAAQTFVDVDTHHCGRVRTSVRTWGSGPPLLLVHGLMTTAYSWRYLMEPLGERYTLVMPELPGAGESAPSHTGDYRPAALAEWLGALQRTLEIRGGAVIANSMAGYLAMRLALADPAAISRLVTLHAPAFPTAQLRALDVALRLPLAKAGLSRFIARAPERFAHSHVHYYDETLKSLEEARTYAAPLRTAGGRRAFIEQLHQTMGPRGLAEFAATLAARQAAGEPFPVEMLLIYARRDPLVAPAIGERLHALTGAPLVWIEHGSHFAHVDAVDELLPHLAAGLDGAR